MKWIDHHDPILEIIDDNDEVTELHDLSALDYDALFEFLDNKGFARKA